MAEAIIKKFDDSTMKKINTKIDELMTIVVDEVAKEYDKTPFDPNFPILSSQALTLQIINIITDSILKINLLYTQEMMKNNKPPSNNKKSGGFAG